MGACDRWPFRYLRTSNKVNKNSLSLFTTLKRLFCALNINGNSFTPMDLPSLEKQAQTAFSTKQWEDTVALYSQCIVLHQAECDASDLSICGCGWYYFNRGEAYKNLQKYPESIADNLTASTRLGNPTHAHFKAGHLYFQLGDFKQATQQIGKRDNQVNQQQQ